MKHSISERFYNLGFDDPNKEVRLGIMGGTFDPIHFGHLVTAEHARETFGLDAVLFVPTGKPVRKQGRRVTNSEIRYQMVKLAVAKSKDFDVSRIDIDRAGLTYTVDTLNQLRDYYPDNVKLYFITGCDAIMDIVTWKDADKIAKLATLIGATRPGYDFEHAKSVVSSSPAAFDVQYLEIPALSISSTYLRKRIREGFSGRYLAPNSVLAYIQKEGLYRDEELDV